MSASVGISFKTALGMAKLQATNSRVTPLCTPPRSWLNAEEMRKVYSTNCAKAEVTSSLARLMQTHGKIVQFVQYGGDLFDAVAGSKCHPGFQPIPAWFSVASMAF